MSGGIERRRSKRKQVLETFQVFLVIPKAGLRKLHLRDVSEHGMRFVAEENDRFKSGDVVECFFYINPSLRLPLTLKIAHVTEEESQKGVGCELVEGSSKGHEAFLQFIKLLDELSVFLES